MKTSLKGTWPQALISFFAPILLILAMRWAVIEPYVIPSGSMIPNLMVHDHVFVKKFSFGVRLPFSDQWLFHWSDPQPGDIVVFRYPGNPSVFYVKRLVAGPGAKVRVAQGRITVDGKSWPLEPTDAVKTDGDFADFNYFLEDNGRGRHVVRFDKLGSDRIEPREWTIPAGEYFFMGDNRDQSSDSRVWGMVPEKDLIGRAWFIWLSCDEMLESAKFLCDPSTLRWNRLFRNLSSP